MKGNKGMTKQEVIAFYNEEKEELSAFMKVTDILEGCQVDGLGPYQHKDPEAYASLAANVAAVAAIRARLIDGDE